MAGAVNYSDSAYPKMLLQIPSPPKKLYFKGNYSEKIFENSLAVVGSRKMSPYGERALEKIFSTLSSEITIDNKTDKVNVPTITAKDIHE